LKEMNCTAEDEAEGAMVGRGEGREEGREGALVGDAVGTLTAPSVTTYELTLTVIAPPAVDGGYTYSTPAATST